MKQENKKGVRLSTLAIAGLIAAGYSDVSSALTYLNDLTGTSYQNPALISTIQNKQIILGSTGIWVNNNFSGSYAGTRGSATSRTNNFLPYGKIAFRLSPEFVAGLNVYQSWFTNFDFPINSFINTASVRAITRGVNISPILSWQATKQLALAAGLNFDYLYSSVLSSVVPPLGVLKTSGDTDMAPGWNVGLFYAYKPGTFISASYFSQIIHHVKTTSTWGALSRNGNPQGYTTPLKLPPVITLDLIQYLSKQWVIDAQIRYVKFDIWRYLTLPNTPIGVITLTQNYHNVMNYGLSTKYDVNDKWAGLAFILYSPSEQPTAYVNPSLPVGSATIFGAGGEYKITPEFKAKLVYGHMMAKPRSDLTTPFGKLSGTNNVHSNSLDLSFSYDV